MVDYNLSWFQVTTNSDLSQTINSDKLDVSYERRSNQGLSTYCTFNNYMTLSNSVGLKGVRDLIHCNSLRFLQVRHYINNLITESKKAFENTLLNLFIMHIGPSLGLKTSQDSLKDVRIWNNKDHLKSLPLVLGFSKFNFLPVAGCIIIYHSVTVKKLCWSTPPPTHTRRYQWPIYKLRSPHVANNKPQTPKAEYK